MQASAHNTGELEEKVMFQLIRYNKQFLDLFQDLKKMDPQRAQAPEYIRLCTEEYVATKQYEKALAFVGLLNCTSQSLQAMPLDRLYLLKIYVQAARQALLQGSPTSKQHFKSAFQEAMAGNPNEPCGFESLIRRKTTVNMKHGTS